MSVYLDTFSGKMFNTLAELKAFQKGESKGSPVVSKKADKEQEVEKKEPAIQVQDVAEESTEESTKNKPNHEKFVPDSDGIKVVLTPDQMKEELKESGVDSRSYNRKDDEALAEFYYNFVKNRHRIETM